MKGQIEMFEGYEMCAPEGGMINDRMSYSEQLIQTAREMYAGDDLEIDESPAVSMSDEGAWVQAWVWVSFPDREDD